MIPTSRKLLATVALGALAASTIAVSISGAQTESDGTRSAVSRSETARSENSRRESASVAATTDVALLKSVLGENGQDLGVVVLEEWDDEWDDADWEDLDLEDFEVDEWDPTPEEIAEINQWTAEEIAALEAAGVPFTVETDEYGIQFANWSEADDEAAIAALHAIWEEWDDFDDFEIEDFDAIDCDVELDDDAFITS